MGTNLVPHPAHYRRPLPPVQAAVTGGLRSARRSRPRAPCRNPGVAGRGLQSQRLRRRATQGRRRRPRKTLGKKTLPQKTATRLTRGPHRRLRFTDTPSRAASPSFGASSRNGQAVNSSSIRRIINAAALSLAGFCAPGKRPERATLEKRALPPHRQCFYPARSSYRSAVRRAHLPDLRAKKSRSTVS